jgi:hypothetical protein
MPPTSAIPGGCGDEFPHLFQQPSRFDRSADDRGVCGQVIQERRGREEDDRRVGDGGVVAEAPLQLDAGRTAVVQVREDQDRVVRVRGGQCLVEGGRARDEVTVRPQDGPQQVDIGRLVVEDEDPAQIGPRRHRGLVLGLGLDAVVRDGHRRAVQGRRQEAFDVQHEGVGVDGFGDVRGEAGGQRLLPVAGHRERGHREDRHVGELLDGADLRQGLETVDTADQLKVHHDQIGWFRGAGPGDRVLAVADRRDHVAMPLQQVGHEV